MRDNVRDDMLAVDLLGALLSLGLPNTRKRWAARAWLRGLRK